MRNVKKVRGPIELRHVSQPLSQSSLLLFLSSQFSLLRFVIMPSRRYRRYALTFYSPPDFVFDTDAIRYFIAGEEVCPETKRTHWQSYIELFQKTSLTKLKALVDDQKVHAERCKGSPASNVEYCRKDGKIYREEGKLSNSGKRNDLVALREHFKSSKKLKTAIEDDVLIGPVARYPRLVNTLQLLYSVERDFTTELYVFWGVPGSGKSHRAFHEAKSLGDVYFKPSGPWWDGYSGQTCVIFEDFRGETGLAMLLRLCDRYPLRVPVKGGFHQFISKRCYITSNLDIHEWFNTDARGYEVSIQALRRRITKKVHFPTRWTRPASSESKEEKKMIG